MAERKENAENGPEADAGPVTTAETAPERRQASRIPGRTAARIHSLAGVQPGTVRDLSISGLFVELAGDLLLEVELDEDGRTVRRPARLVRSQRLPGGRTGCALEFLDQA